MQSGDGVGSAARTELTSDATGSNICGIAVAIAGRRVRSGSFIVA
jgi:hypothetical protein